MPAPDDPLATLNDCRWWQDFRQRRLQFKRLLKDPAVVAVLGALPTAFPGSTVSAVCDTTPGISARRAWRILYRFARLRLAGVTLIGVCRPTPAEQIREPKNQKQRCRRLQSAWNRGWRWSNGSARAHWRPTDFQRLQLDKAYAVYD